MQNICDNKVQRSTIKTLKYSVLVMIFEYVHPSLTAHLQVQTKACCIDEVQYFGDLHLIITNHITS